MVKADAILEKVISGRGRIQFRDFQKLLVELGFRLDRTRGSHHIYVHPEIQRSFSGSARRLGYKKVSGEAAPRYD
jgi:hypothetical protein